MYMCTSALDEHNTQDRTFNLALVPQSFRTLCTPTALSHRCLHIRARCRVRALAPLPIRRLWRLTRAVVLHGR